MSVAGTRRSLGGSNLYRGIYRQFTSTLVVNTPIIVLHPITVMAWFWMDAELSRPVWTVGETVSTSFYMLRAGTSPQDDKVSWTAQDDTPVTSAAETSNTFLVGRWNHAAGQEVSPTERYAWLNGDLNGRGSNTTSRTVTISSGSTTIGSQLGASTFDDELAWVCVWNCVLTDTEIIEGAAGKHPLTIRPECLISCVPCVGINPEPDLAPRASEKLWTVTGAGGADDRSRRPAPPVRRYEQELILAHQYEQEGYRWRDDDGSESAATFLEAQDTDITRAKAINTRLRSLTDSTVADPPTADHATEYRKVGDADTEWREIPL